PYTRDGATSEANYGHKNKQTVSRNEISALLPQEVFNPVHATDLEERGIACSFGRHSCLDLTLSKFFHVGLDLIIQILFDLSAPERVAPYMKYLRHETHIAPLH